MSPRKSPIGNTLISRALFGMVLAAPFATVLITPTAWAQTSVETEFNIPAGPVSAALEQFAAIADVTVSFEPDAAREQKSPG